ncbi:MAG: methyltransferase domain-containing protein [Rhodospirillaceae bacterium]|nr:methyltransferase domain-containing protein [Rhodospirillaceae bacterium]
MSAIWDPTQYARFSDARSRPARELIARIPLRPFKTIVDLGCGDGPVTHLLSERWPEARITGIDSSSAMLATARAAFPGVRFVEADVAAWSSDAPVDLLFSNAALQWLDHHSTLMPRLFAQVPPGGVFAVQMPGNFDAPSHRTLAALAQSDRWRVQTGDLVRSNPVAMPTAYLDFLGSNVASFDGWETTDYLLLDGSDPVLEWMKGTALRPYLSALPPSDAARFMAELARLLADAYPTRADGRTVFPFRRIYFIATRK